ncbi:MAG TPA: adenosine deaminase [Terriglobia bacterium]|nr:adenosine deaminase [Terriglobia bacterium]
MPHSFDPEPLINRLPKVELHLHLEGSIRPATLREIAQRKGLLLDETECWIKERERQGFRYPHFGDFLNAFKLLSLLLETPADYALATTRLIEELSAESVCYAEVTFSAGVVLWKKQSLDAVFAAIAEATSEASARLGLQVRWIFDAVRQFGVDHVCEVMHDAARFREEGVVAFGIGGDEVRGPARLFADVYREARDLGLHLTAHAGESAGPESVRDAVEQLGAERIGHGTSAARDIEVVRLLAERHTTVEACLTSNLATGLIGRIEDYPLRQLIESRVPVTINTDDPAMFGTSIGHEMSLAATHFALTADEIIRLAENAIRGAFATRAERQALLDQLLDASESAAGMTGLSVAAT